jgi:hypothetical protein
MSYETWLREMYFLHNEERRTWGEKPIPYEEYVTKNSEWLERMYEEQEKSVSNQN